MIEKILLDYLNAALAVSVYTEMPPAPEKEPSAPEKEYVLIERTGGDETDGIRYASIAVQSCSKISLLRAAQIDAEVVTAMHLLADRANVYSARLSNDYNFTNPNTKTYRYQAVFDIYY